jgi:hypothetical protein
MKGWVTFYNHGLIISSSSIPMKIYQNEAISPDLVVNESVAWIHT